MTKPRIPNSFQIPCEGTMLEVLALGVWKWIGCDRSHSDPSTTMAPRTCIHRNAVARFQGLPCNNAWKAHCIGAMVNIIISVQVAEVLWCWVIWNMLIHMSLSHAKLAPPSLSHPHPILLDVNSQTIVLMKSFLCHYNVVITYSPCMCACDWYHHELHLTLESKWSILKGLLNLLFFVIS